MAATKSSIRTGRRRMTAVDMDMSFLPGQEAELDRDDGEDDEHQQDRPGGGPGGIPGHESPVEDLDHHEVRGSVRTAAGEDLYRREDQEIRDRVRDEHEQQRAPELGDRDGEEGPEPARAVDGGGLVEFTRDVVQACDEEH